MGRQSTPGGVALRPCQAVPAHRASRTIQVHNSGRCSACAHAQCHSPSGAHACGRRPTYTPAAPSPSPSSKVFLICSVTHVSTRCLRLAWPTVLYTIHASMQLADGFGVWTLCTRHAGIVGPRERACTWAVLSRRCPRQPHRSNRST